MRTVEINGLSVAIAEDAWSDGEEQDLKVNDRVKVVGGNHRQGESGKIIQSHGDGDSHTVQFDDGTTASFHQADLRPEPVAGEEEDESMKVVTINGVAVALQEQGDPDMGQPHHAKGEFQYVGHTKHYDADGNHVGTSHVFNADRTGDQVTVHHDPTVTDQGRFTTVKENGRTVWQGHEDADQGVAPSDGRSLGYGDSSASPQVAGSLDDTLAQKYGIDPDDADEAESSTSDEQVIVTADGSIVVISEDTDTSMNDVESACDASTPSEHKQAAAFHRRRAATLKAKAEAMRDPYKKNAAVSAAEAHASAADAHTVASQDPTQSIAAKEKSKAAAARDAESQDEQVTITLPNGVVETMQLEKYIGFKKLSAQLAARGDVDDPDALAASIGRKKYGSKGFSSHKHG